MNKQEANKFKKALKKGLKQIANEERGKEGEWTTAIKRCLLQLAQDFDLSSNFHLTVPPGKTYVKHDNHEWLYDAILFKATEKGIEEIILCVESEWNSDIDELFWDFSKLLVAKSKFHLMIFDAQKGKYEETLNEFKKYINNSKICKDLDETYIFATYLKEDNEQLRFYEHKYKNTQRCGINFFKPSCIGRKQTK